VVKSREEGSGRVRVRLLFAIDRRIKHKITKKKKIGKRKGTGKEK